MTKKGKFAQIILKKQKDAMIIVDLMNTWLMPRKLRDGA